MKIGNTDFNENAIKGWSFKKFKEQYEGILKGIDLEEAFKKLGGKVKSE